MKTPLPFNVTVTDSGNYNANTFGGHYSAYRICEGRIKCGRKEDIGECEDGDARRKQGWRKTSSRAFPLWASVSCSVKWAVCTSTPGAVRILQNYTARVLSPATTMVHVFSLPLWKPISYLPGSSPRVPTFLLPTGSTPSPCNSTAHPPPPDPGLMHCSLSLQTACWLLPPAHSPPSPDRHF